MRNELEKPFGDNLHQVVAHLIKHAIPIPDPVIKAALAFEDSSWPGLDEDEKRERVRKIAEATESPSAIHRHFESYPHHFSRDQYTRYLGALKNYKMTLGL